MRQVIIYAGEDGYWVAECPSLPGCISQGKTKEEAITNIKEAIHGYIAALEEDNLQVPEDHFDALLVAVWANYQRFLARSVSKHWRRLAFISNDRKVVILFWGEMIHLLRVVVPNHKELDRGTLRAIIQQAGISVDEFLKLL